MNYRPSHTRRVWPLLATPFLLAASLLAQAPAPSGADGLEAKSDAEQKVIELEPVSVTGTNIKRLDVEKVLPVTLLNQEAMEARNAITPADLLTALPQVTNLPINETTQGSAGARGDIAAINLRGIGASNSLVLLDGRRLVAHPTSGGLNYSTNINQLPTQGIAQIEILRDSASSVYGSDAVAGVVNYIMRRDFRGTELRVRFGAPEQGEGQSIQTTLGYGMDFAGGKGRIFATIDYLYRDAIYLSDRDFTKSANHIAQAPAPFNVPGSGFDGRAVVGIYPTFLIAGSATTNYFRPVNGALTLTSAAPTRAANPEFYTDLNTYFIGQPRSNRTNVYSSAEYDIKPQITAFGDVLYYNAHSMTQRQPISITAPTVDMLAPLSVDNPYNPYGSRFYDPAGAPNPDGTPRLVGTPKQISLASEYIKGNPPDKTLVDADTYRIVAGLRGKFFSTWTWEIGSLFSRSSVVDRSPYYVRESLLQKALMRTDASAFNPFGYTFKVVNGAVVPDQVYNNPQSVLNTFDQGFRRDGRSELRSADGRASGQIFDLWSGPVSLAVGAEGRRESFSDLRPPYVSVNPPNSGLDPTDNDFLQFPPAPDSNGHRTVASAYAETVIPLSEAKNHVPLVQQFEVTGSARYEHFSDFGSTTKPKVGVNWRPASFVMLRASYSEGFTAPSLPLLYQPAQYNTSGGTGTIDPYRNPVTNEGGYATRTISSGNRQLKAADSIGRSIGAVVDVPMVKGLSFSADYWEISRTNVISSRSTTEILNTDANLLRAATVSALSSGTPIGSINLGSGTSAYKGDPAVVRYAVSPADIAAFANSTNAAVVGQILSISTPFLNLAEDFASGWDLSLNYVSRAFSFGRFTLNSDWAYLRRSYTIQAPPNATPVVTDRININGASRWHNASTIAWRMKNWSAGWSAYYTGSFGDTGATTTQALWDSLGHPTYITKQFTAGSYSYYYRIHDSLTYNATVAYHFGSSAPSWLHATSLRLGIINVFDKAPPLASGATGYSTGVYQNLLAGRTWTFEVTKQF